MTGLKRLTCCRNTRLEYMPPTPLTDIIMAVAIPRLPSPRRLLAIHAIEVTTSPMAPAYPKKVPGDFSNAIPDFIVEDKLTNVPWNRIVQKPSHTKSNNSQ